MHVARLAAALPLIAGIAPGLAAQGPERHTLSGDRVAIYNLAGSVRLVEGTGSDVVAEVTARGPDGERLRVESGRVDGRNALRVIYPGDHIVYRGDDRRSFNTTVDVRADGTFGGDRGEWGRGDRVRISSSGSGLEAHADVVVRVPKGKEIEVRLAAGEATVTGVDGTILVDVHAASVTTNRTRGRLDLDTGSGEVSVTDATGDLTLDSGSGSVTLTRISGDRVSIDAGSGAIRGHTVSVTRLGLETGSGRVRLEAVQARDITLDSGSGAVELQLLSDVDDLRVDTGSGSVTIGVPESLGAQVEIASGSGRIDLDVPMTVTRHGRRSLSGTLGDGRGRIRIDTGSGGVRIRRS